MRLGTRGSATWVHVCIDVLRVYTYHIYICLYIHTYLHIRKGIYVYVQIQEQEHVHRVSSIALLERLFSDYKFGQVEEIPPTQVTPPRSRVDRKRKNNHEVKEIQNVALFFDFMLGGVARIQLSSTGRIASLS